MSLLSLVRSRAWLSLSFLVAFSALATAADPIRFYLQYDAGPELVLHRGDPVPDMRFRCRVEGGTPPYTIVQSPAPGSGVLTDLDGDYYVRFRFSGQDAAGQPFPGTRDDYVRLLPTTPEVHVWWIAGEPSPPLVKDGPSYGSYARYGFPALDYSYTFRAEVASKGQVIVCYDDMIMARTGAAAGGTGLSFLSLGHPFSTADGELFSAKIGARGTDPARGTDSVWVVEPGWFRFEPKTKKVAQIGQVAPGAGGARFAQFLQIGGTPDTSATVLARLDGAGARGVWSWRSGAESSSLELVALEGEMIDVRGETRQIAAVSTLGVANAAPGSGRTVSIRQVVLQLRCTDGSTVFAILSREAGWPKYRVLLDSAEPFSITTRQGLRSGARWESLAGPTGYGPIACRGRVAVGASPARESVVVQTRAGANIAVLQSGEAVPGLPAKVFVSFANPVAAAPLIGLANIDAKGGGAPQQVLYSSPQRDEEYAPGKVAILARTGEMAPGTNARYERLLACARPQWDEAGAVWTATLKLGGEVTAANNLGLWFQAASGEKVLLLRTGMNVRAPDGEKRLASFQALTAVPGSIEAPRMSDSEFRVAVRGRLEDGRDVILEVRVP